MNQPHYHKDEQGFLVRCYHNGVNLLTDYKFWIGVTISFPLEHFIWERLWPFYLLSDYLGLLGSHAH